jgi:hypothetical protein
VAVGVPVGAAVLVVGVPVGDWLGQIFTPSGLQAEKGLMCKKSNLEYICISREHRL